MANRADNFNRADDATALGTPSDGGSAWSSLSGQWGIFSNKAYLDSAIGAQDLAVLDAGSADVEVQVTVSNTPNDHGICFRATDTSNYNMVVINPTACAIYKRVAGSLTLIDSASVTADVGDVWRLVANGSSLELFQNGVSVITATDGANGSATLHGLRASSSPGQEFDDFSITDLSAGSPAIAAIAANLTQQQA